LPNLEKNFKIERSKSCMG